MAKISFGRVSLGGFEWIILVAAVLSTLQLSALPPETTIGHPVTPGVPEWVYSHRVSSDLRPRFILMYTMLYERELYPEGLYPTTTAANFQRLAEELGDIFGSFAGRDSLASKDISTVIPEWVWHIDDQDQIKWLHDRIHQEVFKNNLQDIATSPDLVSSYVRARPTTIGPRHQVTRPKLLTREEVIKLLQNPVSEVKLQQNLFNGTTTPAFDTSVQTDLDAQHKALLDAANKSSDEVQRQEPIAQACYPGCQNLPLGQITACMNACSAPFDNAFVASNRAHEALYAFERTNNCGFTHCPGPK